MKSRRRRLDLTANYNTLGLLHQTSRWSKNFISAVFLVQTHSGRTEEVALKHNDMSSDSISTLVHSSTKGTS